MLFSSISFLYFFLPILFLVYFLCPASFRNAILLAASLIFYFYGEPVYILLLTGSCIWNFYMASSMFKAFGQKKEKKARNLLILAVSINVGILVFFKYNRTLPLPLGISFFTFQTLSYLFDVYRQKVPPCNSLRDFSTYVCLFPQLVAGPVVRYTDVWKDLKNRTHSLEAFGSGTERFLTGLGKKILLANSFGMLCNLLDQSSPSFLGYWLSALSFTLQIYFDFSGYSDMALGLGTIFGFHFPENFHYPLAAVSITDFWRRWHMTLSSWFKEYVYIPLGGSRVPRHLWIRNIFLVWMLTGMWHGAGWNYLLWGLYFAVFLLLEKLYFKSFLEKHRVSSYIYTNFLVIISFVIFRHENMKELVLFLKGMFGFSSLPWIGPEVLYYMRSYSILLLLGLFLASGLHKALYEKTKEQFCWKQILMLTPVFHFGILLLCTAFLIDASFNPFLYFRF